MRRRPAHVQVDLGLRSRKEVLRVRAIPGLKIEISTPRTKTCPWGPRTWGTPTLVQIHTVGNLVGWAGCWRRVGRRRLRLCAAGRRRRRLSPAKIAHCPAARTADRSPAAKAGAARAGWRLAEWLTARRDWRPASHRYAAWGTAPAASRRWLVLSVGSFSPGLRRLGGAAGACLSGSGSTSPSLTVRVFDCAVNTACRRCASCPIPHPW